MKTRTLVGALLALMTGTAAAQSYPTKPIRMVVPYPAGESIDATARATAQHWGSALGTTIIIDNRGGAGGTIGTDVVAKAPADGYTILWGNVGPLAIGPSLYSKLPYDVVKNFAPVSQAATLPFVMFISPAVPANTVQEFIAYAKARPKELNFGSTGIGSGIHLVTEMFKMQTGVDITHIPYKGVAQAMPEIVAGRIQVAFNTIPAFLPHAKAGRLKALVIAAPKRSPLLPSVPAAAEAGVPKLIASSWHGVVAPAGTPPQAVSAPARNARHRARRSRGARPARQSGRRADRKLAGGIRQVPSRRARDVGADRQSVRRQSRLMLERSQQ